MYQEMKEYYNTCTPLENIRPMLHYLTIGNIIASIALVGYLAYDHYTHEIPNNASTTVVSAPRTNNNSPNQESKPSTQPSLSHNAEERIISNYFHKQLADLEQLAKEQQTDIHQELPSEEQLLQAVQSKSITSPASKVIITKIKKISQILNKPYTSPIAE